MIRLLIFCLISIISANSNSPVVKINSGLIEGSYISNNITGTPYYSFKGIPYAEPPIGKLRFQPPEKPKPWENTLETKKDSSKCVQGTGGSEDCLYLNVFTTILPTNDKKELFPVMMYIHGGAFIHGSSNSSYYGPEYLIDKNIVLVTINYRLNVFGFLNSMDEFASGNAGLKDQIAALQWIQENIDKFNGDPNNVTIFGHSAGGAACQYLLQSKLAKGLFHKAILQSGSSLNNWALEENPKELFFKLGSILGIQTKNSSELVNLLQNVTSEELYKASINKSILFSQHKLIRKRFVPTLEYNHPNAFITENSFSILNQNKINSVPIIIGYVNFEGLFILTDIKSNKINLKDYEENPNLFVPVALNIKDENLDKSKMVVDEIQKQYFKNKSFTDVESFLKFQTDETFVRGIKKSAEILRKNNDIYFYIFSYRNKDDIADYKGVPHVGELKFIFYTGVEETNDDKLIRQKITTLWTNFAKTGNPTPNKSEILENIQWPVLSKNDKFQFVNIDKQLTIEENPGKENYEFWEKVFDKYGNKPFMIW